VVFKTYWPCEKHDGCLIRCRNCLFFASTWGHPRCLVWWSPCCSYF
jgi:hypothetical protein